MPVPKKNRSNRRTGSHRAAAWKLKNSMQKNKCPQCGVAVMPHHICTNCGFYKGKKVMVTRSEKLEARKERKRKEKDNSK